MQKYQLGFFSALCGGLVACFLLTGCPGKKYDDDDDYGPSVSRGTGKGGSGSGPAKKQLVKGTYNGVIKGAVSWKGDDSRPKTLQETLLAAIQTNRDYCLTGKLSTDGPEVKSTITPFEKDQQELRIGANGNLGNVYVWIEPEDGFAFDIPKEQLDGVAKEVVIHQPHCAFVPHASVHFPSYYKDGKQVPTGQMVVIQNDARVTHNAAVKGGTINGEFNLTLPAKQPGAPPQDIKKAFKPDRTPVTVGCNVHAWMKAYIRVYDHPYAAVTSVGAEPEKHIFNKADSPQFGTFEIKGVPVGAKVKLFAWHESLGFLTPATGKVITLKESNEENFEAK